MSLQDALTFIQKVGADPSLKDQLKSLTPRVGLQEVIALAAHNGLEFTEKEFQNAFVADWNMRHVFFSRR